MTKNKYLRWSPRILGIFFVLFLMLFSLDVFDEKLSGWQIVIGLLIHNIPAILLAAVLAVSWKHEIVGGIAFILAGLLYILLLVTGPNFKLYMLTWSVLISGPALLIGVLFLINWYKRKKVR
jgi:hypothetical protein